MANPTPYARAFSFTGNQAANAYAPPPGVKVDAELDQVAAAIRNTNAALLGIRRQDGTVADGSVTMNSLAPATVAALSGKTAVTISSIGGIPLFATRGALAAGNVGNARRAHVVRYNSDGPVANIIYDIVASPPSRDTTSMAVTGLDGTGANVTLYTSLANSPVLPEHFGAYGDAAPMGATLADAGYLAGKALEHDDTAALQAQINYLQDGDTWTSGEAGRYYAVSASLSFAKHRCKIDFATLVPFGTFSDYLFKFAQAPGGADATEINISLMANIVRLRACGRWQSRGLSINDLYLSNVQGLRVTHAYGTALSISDCYENTWLQPAFALNSDRAVDVSTATAWNSTTTYTVGQQVFINYPAWSGATTYAVDALVTYSGGVYRSLTASNTGNTPASTSTNWVRDEFEYYQAQLGSTNASPISSTPDYTTASDTTANKIWLRIFPHEPLLQLVNTLSTAVADHEYFLGLDIRDSNNKEFIRIDQAAASRPMFAFEFYGGHIEGMTLGVPWIANGSAAGTGPLGTGSSSAAMDTDARANATYVRLSRANRCKFIGCTIRIGGQGSTGFKLGGQHPFNTVSELHIQNTDINGEDQYIIGIYTAVAQQEVKQNIGTVSMALSDATALEVVDPAQRLSNNGLVVPQKFANGSSLRPSIAFRGDATTGFWYTPGVNLPQSRTPPTADSSNAVATTAYVRAYLATKGL